MESRIRLLAVAIIAIYVLLGLGLLGHAWWQDGHLDPGPALIIAGLALIAALVMSAFLAMMPDPRGLVFFGVFFGLILLPQAIGHLLLPPPSEAQVTAASDSPPAAAAPVQVTDLTAGILDAQQAQLQVYADGTQRIDIRYLSAELAGQRFLADFAGTPPPLQRLAGHDGVLVESEGYASFEYLQDARRVRVSGTDRMAVERRLQAQATEPPAIAAPSSAAPPALPAGLGFAQLAGLLLAYTGFVAWVFFRLSTWAASYPAAAGTPQLAASTLRERLLALDRAQLPFTIRPGARPDELVAEWRYADASWLDQMRAQRLRRLIRYRLRLDEAAHRVRVREYQAAFDASAGLDGAALRWQGQWGITFFEKRSEAVLGLQFRDGRPTRDLVYRYRFDLDEFRGPLRRIVNDAGWDWRSVMLDAAWLTG